MAFDLVARLRLDDNFSTPIRRVTAQMQRADRMTQRFRDSNGRLRDSMGRFARQTDNSTHSVSRFRGEVGRGFGGAIKGFGSLSLAIGGVATAFAGVVSAKKIFDATIGEAAKYEQSSVIISAMFDNKKLSKQYMDLVNSFAINSPIMDSQAMFANSKSFISLTKDVKQLEKMWDLAERMAAMDPLQGVEGSVFALRELFSGDATSIVERFELPRKVMKDIKNLSLPQQLKELDKYFNKIGMTKKVVDDVGRTTTGLWQQIKESVAKTLRDMGAPALGVIKKFLDGLKTGLQGGSLSGFQKTGADILKNIAQGFVSAATGIGKWIDSIRNNEEFKKKTTLFGQVKWVIGNIFDSFIAWLDGGGSKQIADTVDKLFQSLSGVIEATTEALLPVAMKVGSAIGSGIISGFNAAIKDSWMLQILSGDSVGFAKRKVQDLGVKKAIGYIIDKKKGASHASGLSRVPYDGCSCIAA
jgi:hypothetical protein